MLLDINLGRGGNGLNIIKGIRKISGCEKLPVIAETAFAMRGDKEEFISAGCNYYIGKPFGKAEIEALLNEVREDVEKQNQNKISDFANR